MRPYVFLLVGLVSNVALAQGPGDDADFARYVAGEESAALEALRRAEWEMFRSGTPLVDLGPMAVGVPMAASSEAPRAPEGPAPAEPWLEGLSLPDLPLRFHDQVVRYLQYFREDPRGRSLMTAWLRRSHRYGAMIERTLEEEGLPRDLRCVAMAESGFDPTVRSHRGAVGLWQFVARTGGEYGLRQDRWIDERMDPVASTRAAARMLGDLQRRFGRWELALAAYNMGYGALLRAIRKYNTNDYWTLAELEAGLPFETTVYVSKILACSVVMRNTDTFGFGEHARDEAHAVRDFTVPGGTTLAQVARAAQVEREEIEALNPHLRRGRVPPGPEYAVHVPAAQADTFAERWTRQRPTDPQPAAYAMRFGETLEDVAYRYRTSERELVSLNAIEDGERLGLGTVLLVPAVTPRERPVEERPVVVVPEAPAPRADRTRVFYRVTSRDELSEIARFFRVTVDEIRRWNRVDPTAALHAGLVLQIHTPRAVDLSRAVVWRENDVDVLTLGSERFFDAHERSVGRVRFRYRVVEGDTVASIARRFGLSDGSLARINRFGRRTDLQVGQEVVVYAETDRVPAALRRALGIDTAPSEPSVAEAPTPAEAPEATEEAEVDLEVAESAPAELDEEAGEARSDDSGDESDEDEGPVIDEAEAEAEAPTEAPTEAPVATATPPGC
ncbi:MAG: transglycosylase SLT domain-containing protein [Sandaracinus sp.]|nr:transglycosylase SLT domain-containing protein [Sandaracinus sp.]